MNDEQLCSCDTVLQQLEDDRIPKETIADIEAHVSTCEACRQTFDHELRSSDWTDDIRPVLSQSVEKLQAFDETQPEDSVSIQADIDRLLGPTDDPHMLGRIGAYEVVGVIGQGGMGIVFKAFDASLDRFVAIKMLAPHLALSGAARQRFVREGKAAAAVVDDHVMPVYAVDEWKGVPYLVMPYTRGRSLQHRLNDQGPLKIEEVLRIGMQVARGLAAAHAQGLVHRDIKPSNILLSESVERAMLMDFGLARAVDDASMTRTGTVAGTPQYMSPEQARAENIDQRSDLFSLGSVLYTMCSGRVPFRGESAFAVLKLICDKEPRSVTEINSEIPAWLAQIIDRLMSKSPNDRFASADEVADLLEECLAHVQQPDSAPLPAAFQSSRSNNGGGRITKRLATAAMIPALIFAGIVVVLEFSKGTLTITSEADDVPIRIMQGDEVVDTLTVSSDGTSVRVSAGTYRIVLDGPAKELTVRDGVVTMQRRGEGIVSIEFKTDSGGERSFTNPVTSVAHQTAMVILSHPAELKNGNRIQQAAISVAMGQLSSTDYCGVLNYTPDGVQWLWEGANDSGLAQLSDRRSEFMKALSRSQSGDFPRFDPALKMALAALRECSAKNKYLLVLTDGDPTLEDESLLADFRQSEIVISVVHADLHGQTYDRIPRLMAEKTGGSYWVLPKDAPSASFEALFRNATRAAIRSTESQLSQNRHSDPPASNHSGKSPWPSTSFETWVRKNGNGLTSVSINSRSVSGTFQGWITEDRKHVVMPSHYIDDQAETEIEVRTADGRIHDASIVESRGHLTLLSVAELPYPGLVMGDEVAVRENEILYIAGRHSATPVRVLHEAKTTTWSYIPGLRFVDAIVVDTQGASGCRCASRSGCGYRIRKARRHDHERRRPSEASCSHKPRESVV